MTMRKGDLQSAISGPFERLARAIKGFDPNQPRDEGGKWTSGAAGVGKIHKAVEAAHTHIEQQLSTLYDHMTDLEVAKDNIDEIDAELGDDEEYTEEADQKDYQRRRAEAHDEAARAAVAARDHLQKIVDAAQARLAKINAALDEHVY